MTAKNLKRIREGLGLTQEELAERPGVIRSTVTRWELGERRIPELAARLIRLLHAGARGMPARRRKR